MMFSYSNAEVTEGSCSTGLVASPSHTELCSFPGIILWKNLITTTNNTSEMPVGFLLKFRTLVFSTQREKNGVSRNSWHLSPFPTPLPLLPNPFQACLLPSFFFLPGEILITTACAALDTGLQGLLHWPFDEPWVMSIMWSH